MSRVLLAILVSLLLALPSCSQDFEKGMVAFDRGDYAMAFSEWQPLAEQGDPLAQFGLGNLYESGSGVPKNRDVAFGWYKKAADQGLFEAQALIFSIVPRDSAPPIAKVIGWLVPVAENGNTFAQFELAYIYQLGDGVERDLETALMWYEKAAAGGGVDAQNNLALMYSNGEGVARDYSQALYWFKKAAAQGKAIPQLNLASAYAKGEGTPQDLVSAMVWATVAAANGDPRVEAFADQLAEYLNLFERAEARRRFRVCMATNYQSCD